MTGAVLSLLIPGFGHALRHRRGRALAWAAIAVLAALPLALTVWALLLVVGVRVGGAADAWRCSRTSPPRRDVGALIGVLFILGAGMAGVRFGVVDANKIMSAGMTPTLVPGDHIYANLLAYVGREPARGDIIEYIHPCPTGGLALHRVVALAGDTVELRCGVLYLGGQPVPGDRAAHRETLGGQTYEVREDDARSIDFPSLRGERTGCDAGAPLSNDVIGRHPGSPECAPQQAFVVPEGAVFVLGDNRDDAVDSRTYGVVPLDHVRGRLVGIWLTTAGDGPPSLGRVGDVH